MGARLSNDLPIGEVTGHIYLDAHEASGVFRSARSPSCDTGTGDPQPMAPVHRARAGLRRYVASAELCSFCTFTLREPDSVISLAGRFRALIKRERRDGRFPYAWVLEAGLTRPHVHLFSPQGRAEALTSNWRWGTTDTQHLEGLASLRAAANYASKEFLNPPLPKRYNPARGFQPEAIQISAATTEEFLAAAIALRGGEAPTTVHRAEWGAVSIGWGEGSPSGSAGSFCADRADEFCHRW